jgi:GNAT superfamily N-acetyltransferase
MPIAVRRLGPGDEAVLEQLAREAPEFDLAGRSTPDEPLAPADAAAYLADESVLHWIAEEQGRVVGELLCHVLGMPHGPGRELLLYSIGVREGHRRRGVGRALVEAMVRWAAGTGVREVWVLADNPGAEAFYEACGFRRGAEDEQGVLWLLDVA